MLHTCTDMCNINIYTDHLGLVNYLTLYLPIWNVPCFSWKLTYLHVDTS